MALVLPPDSGPKASWAKFILPAMVGFAPMMHSTSYANGIPDLAWKKRTNPDRWEGVPTQEKRAAFEILGIGECRSGRNGNLPAQTPAVRFYLPPPMTGQKVLLIGRTLQRYGYRVEPIRTSWSAGWNTFEWPRAILAGLDSSLTLYDLGFIAKTDSVSLAFTRNLLPVWRSGSVGSDSCLEIDIQASRSTRLHDLTTTLRRHGDTTVLASHVSKKAFIPGGFTERIFLKPGKSLGSSTALSIEFSGKLELPSNWRDFKETYVVFLPPNAIEPE